MKQLFNKPYKIVISIILLVALILNVALIFILFLPSYNKQSYKIEPDNDINYYSCYPDGFISCNTFCNHLMSYSNGNLMVNDFDCTYTDIYAQNEKRHITTPKCSQIITDKMVYLDTENLYYKNMNTNKELFIKDICSCFIYDGKNLVFESDDDLYISEIISDEKINSQKIYTFNEKETISYLQVIDDKLYVITFFDNSESYISKFNFYIFDIGTMTMVDSCNCTMSGSPEDIVICNGNFIFHHNESSTIFKVDFENNTLIRILEHEAIVDLASNGEKVYFVAEKSEWAIIRYTVDAESNGIWALDINNGNIEKISDKCVIDELLVTDNYIYCYTIDYTYPRGVSNSNVNGYKLQQIPIN